ncbi:MAG: hypothetical protein K2P81_03395 [Bacteriovoracaceae bacterium]|nr:hypothetical protein [Bacteriovoracaceae bacterium]
MKFLTLALLSTFILSSCSSMSKGSCCKDKCDKSSKCCEKKECKDGSCEKKQ